jgi:hypothetical protein
LLKKRKEAPITGRRGKERRTRGKKRGRRTVGRREKIKIAFIFVEKRKRSSYNRQDRKGEKDTGKKEGEGQEGDEKR